MLILKSHSCFKVISTVNFVLNYSCVWGPKMLQQSTDNDSIAEFAQFQRFREDNEVKNFASEISKGTFNWKIFGLCMAGICVIAFGVAFIVRLYVKKMYVLIYNIYLM